MKRNSDVCVQACTQTTFTFSSSAPTSFARNRLSRRFACARSLRTDAAVQFADEHGQAAHAAMTEQKALRVGLKNLREVTTPTIKPKNLTLDRIKNGYSRNTASTLTTDAGLLTRTPNTIIFNCFYKSAFPFWCSMDGCQDQELAPGDW